MSIHSGVLDSFINRRLCSAWMKGWLRVNMMVYFCILFAHWVQSAIPRS